MEQIETFMSFFWKNLWQTVKSLLCAAQFYIFMALVAGSMKDSIVSDDRFLRMMAPCFFVIPAVVLIVALPKFYDGIDDASFLALCDEESPVHLMRRWQWLVSVAVLAVSLAYGMGEYLWTALSLTGISTTWGQPLCVGLGFVLVAGIRVWQVNRLYRTWVIQKELYDPAYTKFPSVPKRIGQAFIFFGALGIGCAVLPPFLLLILMSAVSLLTGLPALGTILLVIVCLLVALWLLRIVLRLWKRRTFLKRLHAMVDKGEISMAVEGHPYISVVSPRAYFGIRITDLVRVSEKEEPKTYLVSVFNTQKRRLTVNLRERHVVQIVHEIRLQLGPTAMIMAAHRGKKEGMERLSHTLYSWNTNYEVTFPEGEGEKTLIIDPAPYTALVWQGSRHMAADNGSKVYDYTLWTKNALANFIERT